MDETGKPSREEALAHFGIRGMKWGVRKKRDANPTIPSLKGKHVVAPPERPRALSTKTIGRPVTKEDELVGRVIQQAYARQVAPAMNKFVDNIPKHNPSSDPRVNALLERTLSQGLNRVEQQAAAPFMRNLPATFRQ